jgi:branched-chain amino acid transport system permease protein
MVSAVQLLQSLVNGAGVGLIYGLIGIGFCVIYNASGIVNFAQGVFVMLGGMVCHALLTRLGLPIVVAAALAIAITAAIGMLIEIVVVRPMWDRGAALFAIVLATLAVQIMIERITILTLGDQPRSFDEFTTGGPLKLGDIAVSYQLFWILGGGALMVLLLWLFFTRTRTGRALRACSQNREAAALLGIPVSRMLLVSFALSAALGAAAGILVTPTQITAFNVGTPFGVSGFIAAIIGGFGSAAGALAGGVLLGILQAVAIVVFGAGFKNVAALSTLLVVLLFFPSGIFAGLGGLKKPGH